MSANDKQVAGNHYQQKEGEQHWDRVYRLYGRGYFIGCATKYLERYHLKNGKQDLEKAIHFIEKLIELEYDMQTDSNAPNFSKGVISNEKVNEITISLREFVDSSDPQSDGYVNQDGCL